MRMNRKAALAAGASLGIAFLAACSDSPTAPPAPVSRPSLAIGDITDGPAPEAAPGVIIVCKTGDVGGDFVFGRTTEGPNVDPNAGVASNQTIATGKCLEVAPCGADRDLQLRGHLRCRDLTPGLEHEQRSDQSIRSHPSSVARNMARR